MLGYCIASKPALLQVLHRHRFLRLAEQFSVLLLFLLKLAYLSILLFVRVRFHVHRRRRTVSLGRIRLGLSTGHLVEHVHIAQGRIRTRFLSSFAFRFALSSSSFRVFSFVAPRTVCWPVTVGHIS